jgi:hypothetical protein
MVKKIENKIVFMFFLPFLVILLVVLVLDENFVKASEVFIELVMFKSILRYKEHFPC